MLNNNSVNKEKTSPITNTNRQPKGSRPTSQTWVARHKKPLLISGAVILLLALAGVVLTAVLSGKHKSNNSFKDDYSDACQDRPVTLSSAPLPLDQLGYIVPLGLMSDGHVTPTDHQYVWPKNTSAADNTHSVIMPAAGTVVEISAMPNQYIGDRQQQTASEDHRIVVSHSCRYFSIFIHVHKLSPALKAAAGNLQPSTSKRVNVELKAGDLIGKIGGSGVDWTYLDTSKKLKGFITPSLYDGESWKIHTIDPISLYTGELQATMAAASLRTVAPIGGKIDYDVRGALAGNWFRQGTNGYKGKSMDRYWDGHLSIVPDSIDTAATIFSTGNWDGKAAQYAVKGAFDPASITKANGTVKFEVIGVRHLLPSGEPWTGFGTPVKPITVDPNGIVAGTVLVQVQDGEKLKIEQFAGKSADQVQGFTTAAQTYTR